MALAFEARKALRIEREGAAVAIAGGAALNIQRQLSRSLAAVHVLAALVRDGKGVTHFEEEAQQILHLYGGISSLQLQPDGVIRRVYPLAGNEAVLGLDLLRDPVRRQWALATIESRQLTLDGPYALRQGGLGLVGRIAVFIPDADGRERFWGFAAVALRVDDFLRAAEVKSLEDQGYNWSLTTGASATAFAGSDPPPRDGPVSVRLSVPNNGEWVLAAAPRKGWTSPWAQSLHLATSLALAVAVGLLVYPIMRHPERLRLEVLARTQDLDRANHLLHSELAERKQAEAKFQASQEQLRRILEAAGEGIWAVDVQGRTEFANARAAEMFGLGAEEMLGRRFFEIVPEGLRQEARADPQASGAGANAKREVKVPRADGSELWLILSTSTLRAPDGTVAGSMAVFTDVTGQHQAQEELQQAQKLEAVGRLAAGIAHELNTPIQFIGDNTCFLDGAVASLTTLVQRYRAALAAGTIEASRGDLERAAEELDIDYLVEQTPKTCERTREGVQRISSIVRAMKEFAHPDQKEMVATDLNRALLATLEVSRNEYRYVAEVKTDLGELPLVTCYPGELNQVFLNLIVNASQAIEDAVKGTERRGTIRVATRANDSEVTVSISDSGGGIPDDIRAKIFDQFFTTKEVGRGTGQGLAIARKIVRKHHGQLTFTTEIGHGTSFLVRLPVESAGAKAA